LQFLMPAGRLLLVGISAAIARASEITAADVL
jgi:hypothetical protein